MKIMSERTDRHINNMEAAHKSSFSAGAAASTLPPARVTVYREAGSSDVSTSALSIFQAGSLSVCPWRALTWLLSYNSK